MTPGQLATLRLLALDGLGPNRYAWLVGDHEPDRVLADVLDGATPPPNPPRGVNADMLSSWRSQLRGAIAKASDQRLLERYDEVGVVIVDPDDAVWPFADDPEPPPQLFCLGNTQLLSASPTIAIVGSRRCTSVGRTVAERMGAELAAMGISVISGLALGVDGEAHRGVFKAWDHRGDPAGAPIGVVASGLDIVYPKTHRSLWGRVATDGLLVSETPLGVAPARWRFPARNRLIAALADAVVVVESHERGGALGTVDEAATRDVPVLVVPGSVLSPAADGTNRLLVDGAVPVRTASDVVEFLGLVVDTTNDQPSEQLSLPLDPVERRVCEEITAGSLHVEQLAVSCAVSAVEMLAIVQRLALGGHVVLDGNRVRLP